MSEKIADLQLPMTCITRLIKEALPDNAQVKQECKIAIAKSASVFILFLTSAVTDITTAKGQKTISADHVLSALEQVEMEHMIPELKLALENYRKIMKNKKDKKSLGDIGNTEKAIENGDEPDDDTIEVNDD